MREWRRRRAAPALDAVASVVHRLAVLLAAGVPPASAWRYLADGSACPDIVVSVADRAADGLPVGEAIAIVANATGPADVGAWRGLAAAWQVATEAGAPLAPSLKDLASSLRDLAETRRETQVALAAPIATARMVMVLPAIGLLFGAALGFDTLGTLFTTVPGLVCLVFGLLLIVLARQWNRRLVRSAQPSVLTPGLTLDLLAIAVSGGASIPRASAAVAEAVERHGIDDHDGAAAAEETLSLSRRAGVPAGALLRSEAEEARRTARSEGQRNAAALAVRLMLPLGVCILPAFMLLGVAPLLIAVITSTVAGFR
jgi:tight adherence protein B